MSEIIVLIPHYNNIEGLYCSLASISACEPVDVLIVDDGSILKPDIGDLRERYKEIEYIELICLEKNSGIEAALNSGLDWIFCRLGNSDFRFRISDLKYRYIARLDCGDICHPERFKLQKEFLNYHLDYGMVGSWAAFVELSGRNLSEDNLNFVVRYPETDTGIRKYMLKNNAFAHPAVMIRTLVLCDIGNYSTSYKGAEDYDLFFRIMQISKVANIPQVLTTCELSERGISQSKRRQQIVSRIRLIWKKRSNSSIRVTFGIIRSLLLLVIPYSLILRLKSAQNRKLPNINPYSINPNPQPPYPNPNPEFQIIHVIECTSGGTLDVVVDLVNGMPEYQHVVVFGKRSDTPVDIQNMFSDYTKLVEWKRIQRKIGFSDLFALVELITIFLKYNTVKIIHLHSSKAGFLGRIAAFLCGVSDRVIYTSHGAAFLCGAVSPFKERLFAWLEWFASTFGGRIIACSASEAREFHQRGILAMHINNGVAPNEIIVASKNDQSDCVIVVAAGRIVRQKNPQLFGAIATAYENNDRVRFVWIGDGDCRCEFGENVVITGWQTKQAVKQILASADVYLSTSLWEGMPLSVLQAMQAGLPLLLSSCVGNRDLVFESKNGYLFDDIEAAIIKLELLINNKQLRETMGRRSKKLVEEQYNFENMLDGYRELYSLVNSVNK
ncbi:MAG: glycosyltransferase [Negativicutes bacterium]|jgi:glycosyltransferase involved in cell wall biosynthesis